MEKVKKGLAAGDFFEDGGRVYQIKEVQADGNYLSEVCMEEPRPRAGKAAKTPRQ